MNAGYMLILASPDYPGLNHPLCRFWLHEHEWPIKLSDVTAKSLDDMGIKYKTEVICAEIDFMECFRDGFQKPHQKFSRFHDPYKIGTLSPRDFSAVH